MGSESRVMGCGGGEWEGGVQRCPEPRSPAASPPARRRAGRAKATTEKGNGQIAEKREFVDVGRRRWRR